MTCVGYLLIVVAGLGLGLHYSRRLTGQVTFLRQTIRLLETLGQQLAYTPCPMPQLWQKLTAVPVLSECLLLTKTAEWLTDGDFATAFSKGVEQCYVAGCLTPYGRQLLLEFGGGCGRYDYLRQQAHIRRYCDRLGDLLTDLEADAAIKGRLYRVLGVAGGGALALLLM